MLKQTGLTVDKEMRAVAKREIQWLPPQPPYWDSSVSPHHCWQLLRHHPDLINESVHWEVENTYTHMPPSTHKSTLVLGSLGGWHTLRTRLSLPRLERQLFWCSTKEKGCGGEENKPSPKLLTWFIPKLTQCGEENFRKWVDYVQEKISCKQLTGSGHEKLVLKIHRRLETSSKGLTFQEAAQEDTRLPCTLLSWGQLNMAYSPRRSWLGAPSAV